MEPQHNSYNSVGAGYSFSSLSLATNFSYGAPADDEGADLYPLVGSTYDFSVHLSYFQSYTFVSARYAFWSDGCDLADSVVINLTVVVDESTVTDSVLLNIPVICDESLNLNDSQMPFQNPDDALNLSDEVSIPDAPLQLTDSLNLSDEAVVVRKVEIEDSLDINDGDTDYFPTVVIDDPLNLDDPVILPLSIFNEDPLDLFDDGFAVQEARIYLDDGLDLTDSIKTRRTIYMSFGCMIQRAHQVNGSNGGSFGTEIVQSHFAPPPVQDYSNPANPFIPTIYIPSLPDPYVSQNPGTDKGPSSTAYVSLDDLGYGGLCSLYNLNINLQLGGGSFNMLSYTSPGGVGEVLGLFGLPFVITYAGRSSSNQGNLYKTEGILGDSRYLNKQLLLMLDKSGMSPFQYLAPNPVASAPTRLWATVSAMAAGIAQAAGVPFSWQTVDAPLMDTFLETGMTAGDALKSLAARVGGVIMCDGTRWIAIDPSTGYGGWQGIPHCDIFAGGGAEAGDLLDLVGSVVTIPVPALMGGSIVGGGFGASSLYNYQSPPPPIHMLRSFTQTIGEKAPAAYINIPGDYKDGDIQVLLGPDHPPVPGALPDDKGGPNSRIWSNFSPTVTVDDQGQKKMVIDKSVFDNYPGLVDGEFSLNIGYKRDTSGVDAALSELTNIQIQQQRLHIQSQQERIRYFRKRAGTASFRFFGSIGIPGNRGGFSFNSASISGMIESFTVSYTPRQMPVATMTIGEYQKLNLDTARSLLDAFLAGP